MNELNIYFFKENTQTSISTWKVIQHLLSVEKILIKSIVRYNVTTRMTNIIKTHKKCKKDGEKYSCSNIDEIVKYSSQFKKAML